VPSQQPTPLACSAAAHNGDHSKIAASRHNHAPKIRARFAASGLGAAFIAKLSITQFLTSRQFGYVRATNSPAHILDLDAAAPQTANMAHIYLVFDFASDEEKAQLARHKLETWKQAFRLDKRLVYKFERIEPEAAEGVDENHEHHDKTEKAHKKGEDKGKGMHAEPKTSVKMIVRLAFSGHEKITEQRLLDRIPNEETLQGTSAKTVKPGDAEFEGTETLFEELA
jgi:hypothetical protein